MRQSRPVNSYYIWGWHGVGNAGDDAFAAVMGAGLRKYVGAQRVLMNSDAFGKLSAAYGLGQVHVPVNRSFGLTRLRRAYYRRRARNLILAGGSLFSEASVRSLRDDPWIHKYGGKTVALGVSVGPFVSKEHETLTKECLGKIAYVGFRDGASHHWANSVDLQTPFDLTFDLAALLPEFGEGASAVRSRTLCVCLLARNGYSDQSAENWGVEFVKRLALETSNVAKKRGFGLTLLSMCRYPGYDDDEMSRVFKSSVIPGVVCDIVRHDGDPTRTLAVVGRCSHVVSMRLHGGVFAYIQEIPHLLLSSHIKMEQYADTVGLHRKWVQTIDAFDMDRYSEMLESLLSLSSVNTLLPLEEAKTRAARNFAGLRASRV